MVLRPSLKTPGHNSATKIEEAGYQCYVGIPPKKGSWSDLYIFIFFENVSWNLTFLILAMPFPPKMYPTVLVA